MSKKENLTKTSLPENKDNLSNENYESSSEEARLINTVADNTTTEAGEETPSATETTEVISNKTADKKEVVKELVAKVEVTYSKKELKEIVLDAQENLLLEMQLMSKRFSNLCLSSEELLARSNKLARLAEKAGDHALAGEFYNLHGALGAAQNKLKGLSQKALDHAAKNN